MSIESVFKELIRREVKSQTNVELNDLKQQLKAMDSKINAYAEGLQRVYDQFLALLDKDVLIGMDKMSKQVKDDIKAMRRDLDDVITFNKNTNHKISLIGDLKTLLKQDADKVEKLAKVIKAFDE